MVPVSSNSDAAISQDILTKIRHSVFDTTFARWSEHMIGWLLCLSGVVFPFSVAATNVTLGIVLGAGILSGLWWKGAIRMWRNHRGLCVAMLVYWGIMILGLSWSHDRGWGLHVVGRQWYWLLFPVVMVALGSEKAWHRFMMALSLGLSLNLVFCLLQLFGYIKLTAVAGSSSTDATGHIGHIGFGAIYGMWAGWLMYRGWCHSGWTRIVAWSMASWSWVMIFLAQGRSGYLVALILFLMVLWKLLSGKNDWRRFGWAVGLMLLVFGILAIGPAKERLQMTWQNMQAIQHDDVGDAGPRWSMWRGAIYIWKGHPVLGVGTGGFPGAAAEMAKLHPELNYGGATGHVAAHPHNMYLLALSRWGAFGALSLTALFFLWMRTGWQRNWRDISDGSVLIALSGIALAVHGLTAPSLEEHFEGIMAVLFLGAGLAHQRGIISGWSSR